MLKDLILLQTFTYTGGGQFGNFIQGLSQFGFFSYMLPFLLIFTLIYGILLKAKFFEKNAINAVIALAIALIALQFDVVPIFFSSIFPKLGIGLAVILVILVLMGLFLPDQAWVGYVLFGVSAIIVLVILYQSSAQTLIGSSVLFWLERYWPVLAGAVFVIIVIVLLTRERDTTPTQRTLGDVLPFFRYPDA